MRRLITLHIGRGLEQYPRVPEYMAALAAFLELPGFEGIDLPQLGRIEMQRFGLHPVDATARMRVFLAKADTRLRRDGCIATNDASTINALVEALHEGELRVVSHAADGTVRQWDVDQMMAFWQAREQGSEMTPAAMLIKLGVWP